MATSSVEELSGRVSQGSGPPGAGAGTDDGGGTGADEPPGAGGTPLASDASGFAAGVAEGPDVVPEGKISDGVSAPA